MKTIYDDRYAALIKLFKQRRRKLGLRQEDLAKALGWKRHTISKIEKTQRRLDIVENFAIAKVLGISLRRIERILNQQDG